MGLGFALKMSSPVSSIIFSSGVVTISEEKGSHMFNSPQTDTSKSLWSWPCAVVMYLHPLDIWEFWIWNTRSNSRLYRTLTIHQHYGKAVNIFCRARNGNEIMRYRYHLANRTWQMKMTMLFSGYFHHFLPCSFVPYLKH